MINDKRCIYNMKKTIIILFAITTTLIAEAQVVGINTIYPLQRLHIDVNGDNTQSTTAVSSETADDIVVDAQGNIGIGTASPTAKLDVRKTLQIADGTQANYNLFSSTDNQGLGKWSDPNNLFNPVATWRISTNNITISGLTFFRSSTYSVDIQDNGVGITQNTDCVVVPPGTYIVVFSGEIVNVSENLPMRILDATSVALTNAAAPEVWGADYYEKLAGSSFMLFVKSPMTLGIRMHGSAGASMPSQYPFFKFAPFNNVSVWFQMMFVKVS